MIPYDLDPSLHDGEPHETLDDGFAPAPNHDDTQPLRIGSREHALEAALADKSDF